MHSCSTAGRRAAPQLGGMPRLECAAGHKGGLGWDWAGDAHVRHVSPEADPKRARTPGGSELAPAQWKYEAELVATPTQNDEQWWRGLPSQNPTRLTWR